MKYALAFSLLAGRVLVSRAAEAQDKLVEQAKTNDPLSGVTAEPRGN